MQESYDKRLNILIHGIKEDGDNVWEKREKTIEKFQDFLVQGLKIEDPDDIEFVDIHQLPQHPVKKDEKTFHRPIIVKLLTMSDKNLIFRNAKNLKEYNKELKQNHNFSPYVYVSKHLPTKFQRKRKLFLDEDKRARKN